MPQPNIYHLQGAQLTITYSTGALGSIARFEYQDANQTLIFPESEIRTATSEIGTLVTVTNGAKLRRI